MQRRGTDRIRVWLANPLLLLLLVPLLLLIWMIRNEQAMRPLGYGEFKQVLQAPGVQFRDLHVGRTEIRGKIESRDRISGVNPKAEPEVDPGYLTSSVAFRTPRTGLETDPDLQKLLDKYVGVNYQ